MTPTTRIWFALALHACTDSDHHERSDRAIWTGHNPATKAEGQWRQLAHWAHCKEAKTTTDCRASMYTHTHIRTHTSNIHTIHTHSHTHIHNRIHAYTHAHKHTHTHTHTYTHTDTMITLSTAMRVSTSKRACVYACACVMWVCLRVCIRVCMCVWVGVFRTGYLAMARQGGKRRQRRLENCMDECDISKVKSHKIKQTSAR